jgi:hypothetical protein
MKCRLSWAGPATRPGDAAGPALTPCAGPRLRPMSSRDGAAFSSLSEALRRPHIPP